MTRNFFLFLGTFVAGALVALVVRAARFDPHAGHEAPASAAREYAPMVSNALTPAATAAAKPSGDATTTVNTVCAICGMDVDPKLPTAQYQGRTIGFGCRMCPPKFKADPDRWGPLYLKNEVAKRG